METYCHLVSNENEIPSADAKKKEEENLPALMIA